MGRFSSPCSSDKSFQQNSSKFIFSVPLKWKNRLIDIYSFISNLFYKLECCRHSFFTEHTSHGCILHSYKADAVFCRRRHNINRFDNFALVVVIVVVLFYLPIKKLNRSVCFCYSEEQAKNISKYIVIKRKTSLVKGG